MKMFITLLRHYIPVLDHHYISHYCKQTTYFIYHMPSHNNYTLKMGPTKLDT